MQYNTQEINFLLRNRRSVFTKQFDTTKKVDDAIIKEILENAIWAPNHAHTEPWQFCVFSGSGLNKLATFQSELYKKESGESFKQDKFEKLQQQPLLCSHIISIGMKRTETKKIPEIEEVEAVACAVQNIALSVTAYGLGGYWSTGGITYFDSAKSYFGLNSNDKLLGFFSIGHVAIPSVKATRKTLADKVTWVV